MTDDYNPVPLEIVSTHVLLTREQLQSMQAEIDRLKAELAAAQTTWPAPGVDSTPTTPGWYWLRASVEQMPEIVRVVPSIDGFSDLYEEETGHNVADIGGEWVLIPRPKEAAMKGEAK